jgi:hypothetical protein
MEPTKTIYDLKLHEQIVINQDSLSLHTMVITRVAGGWIYSMSRNNVHQSIFVPWHNDMLNEAIRES